MPILILSFALVGILAGIIINRAADNLPPPARISLLDTPRCPNCNTPRTAVEQFGILSFLLRRNKCHQCGTPLRLRLPIVEVASGALVIFLGAQYPLGAWLIVVCFFTAVLLLIAVIDIEHKLILNVVSLPCTALALLASPIVLTGGQVQFDSTLLGTMLLSLVGAIGGYVITYAIYLLGALFLQFMNRGRRVKINTVAFGMGDVKLAGLLGALVGFPNIIFVLIYAILLGGVGAVIALVLQLIRFRRISLGTAIPYGPYLLLAGWAYMIFHLPT